MFDPNVFMHTEQPANVGNQTDMVGPDEGEYTVMATEFKPRQVQRKDGTTTVVLDFILSIIDTDGRVKAVTGMDENKVTYTVWPDWHPDNPTIFDGGTNKNLWLGRMKEAIKFPLHQPFKLADFLGKPFVAELKKTISADQKVFTNVARIRAL